MNATRLILATLLTSGALGLDDAGADDHGNTAAKATRVYAATPANSYGTRGYIAPAADEDWFKFIPRQNGRAFISVKPWSTISAAADLDVALCDASGKVLTRSKGGDVLLGYTKDSPLVRAGVTYCVRVKSLTGRTTGGYRVLVTLHESAADITKGAKQGALDSKSDVDLYKFFVSRSGAVAINLRGPSRSAPRQGKLKYYLYDAVGQYETARGSLADLTRSLRNPGWYYVMVSAGAINGGPTVARYSIEANTWDNIPTLAASKRQHEFEAPGDVDRYRFRVRSRQRVPFTVTGIADKSLRVYNASTGQNARVWSGTNGILLNPGVYYLEVKTRNAATGTYTLR